MIARIKRFLTFWMCCKECGMPEGSNKDCPVCEEVSVYMQRFQP